MSGPSNIRINPFVGSGGATTYVNLTETHIIPSVSPFVIRLNEVPEKRDPSNMKCVYVDDTTGAVTSRALTEVAATPAAGQFRPDYSTKADKDDSWNTGLIEFNSADAGKIVQITYTGMGTLAAVQSNKYPSWYTDRGDGSDGDFIPSENTTIGGVKNYKRVFIKAGVTVTVDKYVIIKCQDSFVNLGTISANGKGAAGGQGESHGSPGKKEPKAGDFGVNVQGCGAGGAGATDSSYAPAGAGGAVKIAADKHNLSIAFCGGGGGGGGGTSAANSASGNGGNGGGDIVVVANTVIHKGLMTANGNAGTGPISGGGAASGGGGGGRVLIVANTIANTGTMEAKGGKGGTGGWNGAGASGQDGITEALTLGVL